MKKKILIIVSIVVVVALAIVGSQMLLKKPEVTSIEQILPEGAVSYLRADDLVKTGDALLKSPLWVAFESIDFDLFLENNLMDAKQLAGIKQLKQALRDELVWKQIHKFIGQEFVLAIYPFDVDFKELANFDFKKNTEMVEDLLSDALSSFVIVSKLSTDAKWLETLTRSMSQFGAEIQKTETLYRDRKIQNLKMQGVPIQISYYRVGDYLVLSFGHKGLRSVIDVLTKTKTSLADDSSFKKLSSTIKSENGSIFGYTDLQYVLSIAKKQSQLIFDQWKKKVQGAESEQFDLIDAQYKNVMKSFSRADGLSAMSLNMELGNVTKTQIEISFDPSKLDKEMKQAYTCKPSVNKTARFTPENALGYYWMNCFDAQMSWDQIYAEMEKSQTPKGGPLTNLQGMETSFGISVEDDIVPIFGDEVGGYLSNIKMNGPFPLPEFLFFLKVNDKDKLDALLSRLTEQPFMMIQTEDYKGQEIQYLSSPLGAILEPTYAYYEGYWFLSINRPTIKAALDLYVGNTGSLLQSSSLAAAGVDLKEKSRSIYFVNSKEILGKLDGIIKWSERWFSSKDKQQLAFKSGSEKRVSDLKEDIVAQEEALEEKKKLLLDEERQISSLKARGEDPSAKKKEFDALREALPLIEAGIVSDKAQIVELQDSLKDFNKKAVDPQKRDLMKTEVLLPMIEAFKAVESFGVQGTVEEGVLRSEMFIKMSE